MKVFCTILASGLLFTSVCVCVCVCVCVSISLCSQKTSWFMKRFATIGWSSGLLVTSEESLSAKTTTEFFEMHDKPEVNRKLQEAPKVFHTILFFWLAQFFSLSLSCRDHTLQAKRPFSKVYCNTLVFWLADHFCTFVCVFVSLSLSLSLSHEYHM